MQYKKFFEEPKLSSHKRYEALRSFIIEGKTASYVASKFGFTVNSVYSLVKDLKRLCENDTPTNAFFMINKPGPKQLESDIQIKIRDLIVILIKKFRVRFLTWKSVIKLNFAPHPLFLYGL